MGKNTQEPAVETKFYLTFKFPCEMEIQLFAN